MPFLYNRGQRRIGYLTESGEEAEIHPNEMCELTKGEHEKLTRLFPNEVVDAKGPTLSEAEAAGVEAPDGSAVNQSLNKEQLVELGAEYGLELDKNAKKADLIQSIEDHLAESE